MPQVRKTPLQISADADDQILLANVNGDTLYLGGYNVSPTNYQSTLTPGNSATLMQTTWIVSAGQTDIQLRPVAHSGVTGASVGQSLPASLADQAMFFLEDANANVTGVYVGVAGNPVQMLDTTPAVLKVSTFTALPDVMAVSDPTFAWAQDTGALYLMQDGAWHQVGGVGVIPRVSSPLQITGSGTSNDAVVNDASRMWFAPTAGTITGVTAGAEIGPDGQPLIIDILRTPARTTTAASIFPTSTKPQVPVVPNTGIPGASLTPAVPDVLSFQAGDAFQAKVTQIGAQPTGSGTVVGYDAPSMGTTTSYAVTRHPNAQTGDLQIAAFYTAPGSVTWTGATTPGAAWTLLNAGGTLAGGAGASRLWVFYRLDDGNAGPWTFTASAAPTSSQHRRILVRSVNATPIDASTFTAKSANDTNGTPGALTTASANAMEILIERLASPIATVSGAAAAGYTVLETFDTGAPGPSGNWAVAWKQLGASGSQAAPTITYGTSSGAAFARIAVKAGATPGSFNVGRWPSAMLRYTES